MHFKRLTQKTYTKETNSGKCKQPVNGTTKNMVYITNVVKKIKVFLFKSIINAAIKKKIFHKKGMLCSTNVAVYKKITGA